MALLEWAKPTWPQACVAMMTQPTWAFWPKAETGESSLHPPPSPTWPYRPIPISQRREAGQGGAVELA
jgi:hypothetical protein